MPNLPPHHHVGIVVTDIAAARQRLSALLGVTWGPLLRMEQVEFQLGDGTDVVLPNAMCYSVGEPCIELIEELPGSVWECNEHSNLHHIGLWSDDLAGHSAEFGAAGCPMQLCGRSNTDAPTMFAYHRDPELGVRFELVDATMRDAMAMLFLPAVE